MPNSIALRQAFETTIDEVYKKASLTAVLDGQNEDVVLSNNANTLQIPVLTMDGLSDYSRANGYSDGNVTLTYEQKTPGYDRGKKFVVDVMDDMESAGVAFGKLGGEFVRTKVVPELDAYRFAQYASNAGASVTEAITTGAAAVKAIRAARVAIEDAEADLSTCYLFVTPTIKGLIDDLDTTASKACMEGWAGVIVVPASRFGATVALGDGSFTVSDKLNFLVVAKESTLQFQKHIANNIISPEYNNDSDGYILKYRTVGIADVRDNKKPAIYASKAN